MNGYSSLEIAHNSSHVVREDHSSIVLIIPPMQAIRMCRSIRIMKHTYTVQHLVCYLCIGAPRRLMLRFLNAVWMLLASSEVARAELMRPWSGSSVITL